MRFTGKDNLADPRKLISPYLAHSRRYPAAADLARRGQPRPRAAGRLQDRNLLRLPRRALLATLAALIASVALIHVLRRSTFGRSLFSCGQNTTMT